MISLLSLGLLALGTGLAQEPGLKPFDIRTDADFGKYRQVLEKFARKHRPAAANTFCVLGFQGEGETKGAWVVWKEGGQIILWEGQDNLDISRRKIRLKSDVVATEADVQGSTYLVTRAWVNEVTAQCRASGVPVRIPKPKLRR